jgi:hypothetical protein
MQRAVAWQRSINGNASRIGYGPAPVAPGPSIVMPEREHRMAVCPGTELNCLRTDFKFENSQSKIK